MDKDATQLELQLINIRHTSLIPALAEKKKAIRKKRKQRNHCITGANLITAVSLALNAVLMILVYILQAGPM